MHPLRFTYDILARKCSTAGSSVGNRFGAVVYPVIPIHVPVRILL